MPRLTHKKSASNSLWIQLVLYGTNCMSHLIIQLHLMLVLLPSKFKLDFSLCLAGCDIPRQQKKCFIFFVYSLAVFIIQIIGWNMSLFFFITVAAVVHCGMFITHNIRPVFFLLGVKCQLYFDGRVDIPEYDWFLLVCCPHWSWWLSLLSVEQSMNELMAHEESEICVSGCQAGF